MRPDTQDMVQKGLKLGVVVRLSLAFSLVLFSWLVALVWAAEPMGPTGQGGTSIWGMERWSPYAAGIGIGVLSWLTFLLSDNTLGASGSYAKTAGMIEKLFRGRKVEEKTYYREHPPEVGWGWMLLIGLVIGSFISAWLSGDFRFGMVPELWERHFGSSGLLRWLSAFAGGILLGIGSRWADGCTSGHGISGTLQLVVSSWIAVFCFFAAGVATALILF
jgi:uncharacterized protein